MKHILKKINSRGAGGGKQPKVTPATLNPPKLGNFQLGSSFSISESIDLISDGPIEGLVDPEGNLLPKSEISRGVYLDGVAVSVKSKIENEAPIENAIDIKVLTNAFTDVYNSRFGRAGSIFQRESQVTVNFKDQTALVPLSIQEWNQNREGRTFRSRSSDSLDILNRPTEPSVIRDGFEEINETEGLSISPSTELKEIKFLHSPWLNSSRNVSFIQVNNSTFKDSSLINFSTIDPFQSDGAASGGGWGRKASVIEGERTLSNSVRAFFKKRAEELASDDGLNDVETETFLKANANGLAQPFLDLLKELKESGPTSNDGSEFFNEEYYNLIKSILTEAFGNHNFETLSALEVESIILNTFEDKELGNIIIYYPPRDIFADSAEQTVTSTEKLKIELVNNSNTPAGFDKIPGVKVFNLLVPELQINAGENQLTGNVIGAYIIAVPFESDAYESVDWRNIASVSGSSLERLVKLLLRAQTREGYRELKVTNFFNSIASGITGVSLTTRNSTRLKYNYSNVLLEQRLGTENQNPLNYFNKVCIDKALNRSLFGPYKTSGNVQRITRNLGQNKESITMANTDYSGPDLFLRDGLPTNEGSLDEFRLGKDSQIDKSFDSWAISNSTYSTGEDAVPVIHIIHNPNVHEAFITLRINSLFDTVEKDYNANDESEDAFKAGDKLPGILNIEVEVGTIKSNGTQEPFNVSSYRISAFVEQTTLLDIGNPDQLDDPEAYKHVRETSSPDTSAQINKPFVLPTVYNNNLNSDGDGYDKRYIKVTKLSTETFSILIDKNVTLSKITEIIPSYFTYPFSAIFGAKVDTRSFSSVPERTYDARLKKIQIPSNYFPLSQETFGKDRRYYKTKQELTDASDSEKQVYNRDWDGSFKIGWTDNPAWILYDLLTSQRYGLGQQVSDAEINKWELYKVGRFCDAVDKDGNFVGVADGQGGLEPRYSCNILFNSKEKIFDAIQLISNLFRGKTFFRNSEVSFLDQRVKEPVQIFSNVNVKDGVFNYSNFRRDQQFNTVEVAYKDRFENFAPKIETVEDEEDIRNRGVFKTSIEAAGVTSRGMARRIASHLIYKTIKENQRVAFNAGLESILCQPGDLIIIDDELKSNKSNFGKIMSVDVDNEYIRLSGPYNDSTMTGILTVYNPTGEDDISGINDLATRKRRRHEGFIITGTFPDEYFDAYTGPYSFSGYRKGYDLTDDQINSVTEQRFEEYATYTGARDNILYFNTGHTGWVFATGYADEFISDTGLGGNTLDAINFNSGVYAYQAGGDRRDRTNFRDLSGHFYGLTNYLNMFDGGGILESEIGIGSPSQTVTLNLTGPVGTVSGERGSFVSGVDQPQYLQFIKPGSPYRYEVKEASDIIYQIDSIKEENPNEYLISAIKFDTGKYNLIENDISIEKKENTFAYQVSAQVGNKLYTTLDAPTSLNLSTGEDSGGETYFISGIWDQTINNDGYDVNLHFPNGQVDFSGTNKDVTGIKFTGLATVGNFVMAVKAKGNSTSDSENIYFDSDYKIKRSFFLYENLADQDRPSIKSITFR